MSGKKMMPPNVTIWWVPFAGLTTPSAPKATEINAGTNLSAAITTGYKLGATDSDTDNSRTIVDEAEVETPILSNYEAEIELFRDAIGDAPTIFTTAFNLFKTPRVLGYLVKRYGKKASANAAATDVVSVFLVVSDEIQERDSDMGKPVLIGIPFAPQGRMYLNKACVA